MMKLQIYEKPEPLGTVLLGIVEDVERYHFDKLVEVLDKENVEVTRTVSQEDNLPILKLEDQIVFEGAYPDAKQLSDLLHIDSSVFKDVKKNEGLNIAANDTRISACCGVGTDVYLDPYEDEE